MSLWRFPPTNSNAEADLSTLENDRPPTYTSNVTSAPAHTLSGRDPDEATNTLSVAETSKAATPNYSEHQSG